MVDISCERQILQRPEWEARIQAHQSRLGAFVNAHLKRRSRGEKHPVYDFLFEYYSFKPAHLMRWSPGVGVLLEDAADFQTWKEMKAVGQGATLDPARFPEHRLEALTHTLELLQTTAERPSFHSCNGLHEWAMVYRSEEVRHGQVLLRLPPETIAEFVDSQTIRCSHYDAFRFFTPAARPLNVLQPNFEDRIQLEQRGCIHVNMDLYKWAYKFYPWISSDVIADAFEVALAARELDMKASPYALEESGFPAIRIETADGRKEYQNRQREVAEMAQPVRLKLIGQIRVLLASISNISEGYPL